MHLQAAFKLPQFGRELCKDLRLLRSHLARRQFRRVQLGQFSPTSREQLDERFLSLPGLAESQDGVRVTALLEPSLQTFVLDRHRERLVEFRVVLDVQELVRELVKDHRSQLGVAVAEHRAQHRIREFPKRGISGHATHRHVESLPLKIRCKCVGFLLTEVTPISNAAGDGKAPTLRID